MACVDEPEDIDLILVLPKSWDWDVALKPFQYNLISKKRVKLEYGFDLILVGEGTKDEQEWTSFFSQVNTKWSRKFGWPTKITKGLVRILL